MQKVDIDEFDYFKFVVDDRLVEEDLEDDNKMLKMPEDGRRRSPLTI